LLEQVLEIMRTELTRSFWWALFAMLPEVEPEVEPEAELVLDVEPLVVPEPVVPVDPYEPLELLLSRVPVTSISWLACLDSSLVSPSKMYEEPVLEDIAPEPLVPVVPDVDSDPLADDPLPLLGRALVRMN